MYTIYALVDPRDYTVHYVGQTTDVYQRFSQHINGEGSSFIKNAWIFELRALNRMVIMETLEEVEKYPIAIEREAYWIKHFEMLSEPLTNATHRGALKKVKKNQMRVSRQVAYQAIAAVEARSIAEAVSPLPENIAPALPGTKQHSPVNTAYAQEETRNQPVDAAQGTQGARYRLDDSQIKMFCVIYPDLIANKDEALKKVGANTAYRQHANEIIEQYQLLAKKRG